VPNQPATPLVAFRCPPELRSTLERIAAERGMTLSDLIRIILAEYVGRWPEP
jgi:antitoxin component of RelBE/YafQ-DinJ toxin-antitoxin module